MKTLINRLSKGTLLFMIGCIIFFYGCKKSNDTTANTNAEWGTMSNVIVANNDISSIIAIGNSLFICGTNYNTLKASLYLSTDKGNSYTSISNGFANSYSVNSIVASGTKLFASTDNGVYLSSNNGANWTAVNSGIPTANAHINSLVVSGSSLLAGSQDGIYLSMNNGSTWTPASNGLPIGTVISTFTINGNNLFALDGSTYAPGGYIIYKSTNNGTSWTALSKLPFIYYGNDIMCITSLGSNIFAGTTDGVFVSTNNGASWTAANNGFFHNNTGQNISPLVRVLFTNGSDIYAGTDQDGVFKSTDSGANWSQVAKGSSSIPLGITSLAVIGSTVFTLDGAGSVWKFN